MEQLLRKVVQVFGKVVQGFRKVVQVFRKVVQVFRKVVQVFGKSGTSFWKSGTSLWKIGTSFWKSGTSFGISCTNFDKTGADYMIFVLSPMGHGSRVVTKVFSLSRVSEKTVDACHLRARAFTMEADSVTLTCEQACWRACFLTLSKELQVPCA